MKLHTRNMTFDRGLKKDYYGKVSGWNSSSPQRKPPKCANFPKSIAEESIHSLADVKFSSYSWPPGIQTFVVLCQHTSAAASSFCVHLLSLSSKIDIFSLLFSDTVDVNVKSQYFKRKRLLGGLWRDQDVVLTESLSIMTPNCATLSLPLSHLLLFCKFSQEKSSHSNRNQHMEAFFHIVVYVNSPYWPTEP